MKITYKIDSDDWTSGHDDRAKCVDALGEWFEGLSLKTQLAIHYAQYHAPELVQNLGTNEHCPWLSMVWGAQDRVIKKHADWTPGTGFNLNLYTTGVEA